MIGPHFERSDYDTRRLTMSRVVFSGRSVRVWERNDFLPIHLIPKSECLECPPQRDEAAWWHQFDMIGHSITLPLSYESIKNLTALQPKLDLSRVEDILRASANRSEGIFKELEGKHPTRRLTEISACADCTRYQTTFAWMEELCQIWDIMDALGRAEDAERGCTDSSRKNYLWIGEEEMEEIFRQARRRRYDPEA